MMQTTFSRFNTSKLAVLFAGALCMAAVAAQTNQYFEEVKVPLMDAELQTSKDWNLTVEETDTLSRLKRINQGMLSNDITPLEWLGIFADTDERRNHYAALFAKRQLEVMDAVTKFERAYAVAMKHEVERRNSSSDRLLLVTPYQCIDDLCKSNFIRAMDHVNKGGRLDILIRETLSSAQVKQWISANKIPQGKIQSRTVRVQSARHRHQHLSMGIYQLD
ncbi:MAG: hypothetical protein OXI60_09465 [Acidiferrobacterales bacterium]|nr:hypothetical protein [Acidiferrobacterales bacterium]